VDHPGVVNGKPDPVVDEAVGEYLIKSRPAVVDLCQIGSPVKKETVEVIIDREVSRNDQPPRNRREIT
jgi:hypothetical protein